MDFLKSNAPKIAILTAAALIAATAVGSKGLAVKLLGTGAIMGGALYVSAKV